MIDGMMMMIYIIDEIDNCFYCIEFEKLNYITVVEIILCSRVPRYKKIVLIQAQLALKKYPVLAYCFFNLYCLLK